MSYLADLQKTYENLLTNLGKILTKFWKSGTWTVCISWEEQVVTRGPVSVECELIVISHHGGNIVVNTNVHM